MISSGYDFQVHPHRSQGRFCFSQTARLWFNVLPGLSSVLPGMSSALPCLLSVLPGLSSALPGVPRLLVVAARYSEVHPMVSPVLRGVPKPITITPMVLLNLSSEIPVTLMASQNALLGFDTLLKLTHLSLHSTFSQTLLEACSH